jgi:hypothetical protein
MVHQCHAAGRFYCSNVCRGAGMRGRKLSAITRTKMSAAQSGSKSPTWRGGVSRQYKRGYKSEQFKQWRSAVFLRDGHTCQGCGQVGGYLTAHHIKSFALFPDLRYEVGNGVTLCEPCHAERDRYFSRFHPAARKAG